MDRLTQLKKEIAAPAAFEPGIREVLLAEGFAAHYDDPTVITRAYGIASLFTGCVTHIYDNDLIAGSLRGMYAVPVEPAQLQRAQNILRSYGDRHFGTNADHYAPDYAGFLKNGVSGTLARIHRAQEIHVGDAKKQDFLKATAIAMTAFGEMLHRYGAAAEEKAAAADDETARANFQEMARICHKVASEPPTTFREALQLTFMAHIAFVWEWRYAMAFGRMDQFLYPYYKADVAAGRLDDEQATVLLACTLYKIADMGRDDVCNIAIGGVRPDGTGGVNELSYCILEAVKRCAVPGPNLSARLYKDVPDAFLDACLKVIGTGIGYPALMNDEVNIPALARCGYALEDCRNYCMVGCIENFLPGQQPPWSDGRYNSPKYLELALNDGVCMQTNVRMGPATGAAATITSMEAYMERLHIQMQAGAAEYMAYFRNENDRYNRETYAQPFLSCFDESCIERGLDINNGGTKYPSVHGAGCIGIATMADSLAAMEKVVFKEKKATISQLRDALAADFVGYEELQQELLAAPKYGNNDDFVDKYAVWFVEEHDRLFSHYRTPDGGRIYLGIASNIQNISAGRQVAATADGRKNGEPVSDAASPMHGMDRKGPTAVVLSTTKPDFKVVACGTVLNQKYSPSMFSDPEKRAKLRALIRVYFDKGGQEMQINSVSRAILSDAMEHPDNYRSLVVRVSGFSAFYTNLDRSVQEDILKRTEQG